MSDEMLRELVETRWRALGAERTTTARRLRVAQLPVVTHQGSLAAAVDHSGHRHLLVPVQSNRRVRPGLDGPVLELRRRPLEDEGTFQVYADLACHNPDLNDLFTGLCIDVLNETGKHLNNPVKALYRVLDRWKTLFATDRPPLGPEQLAGLFGELLVLERLLRLDSGAHRLWLGPKGHRHDFSNGTLAVEVKSTTQDSGRRVRIHGLDQLDAPVGGHLHLARFRLLRTAESEAGIGMLSLVDRVLRLCDDEPALLGLLGEAGYRAVDAVRYRDVRFVVDDETWYPVTDEFPRLTARTLSEAGLAAPVHDVEYSVEIATSTPAALSADQLADVLEPIVAEPT
jgi:hypothetical protein